MDNQSVFLEAAYKEALSYADTTIKSSKKVREEYTENDAFYYDIKARDIVLAIVFLVAGLAALIFKGKLWDLLNMYVYSRFEIVIMDNFLSLLYILGAIILILLGEWGFFKIYYSKKTNNELKELDQVAEGLEADKILAKELKGKVTRAINNFEYIQVSNENQWEKKILDFQSKADTIGLKTRNIGKWIGIIGSVAVVLLFLGIFNRYFVETISGPFNYFGTLITCISYFIFMVLIYRSQMYLATYYNKLPKFFGIGVFVLYQALLFLQLKNTDASYPLFSLSSYTQGDDPEWVAKTTVFVMEYILNETVLVLALVTFLGVMTLVRTDIVHELITRKDGVNIPLDDGSSRHVDAKGRWKSYAYAILFLLIAPFLMAGILNKGGSVGGVILYLVLGLVWFGISSTFTGDEEKALYKKRLGWVKNCFFFAYMFLTLALVPGFGIGSILLILVSSIISLIAIAIIFIVL